MIYFDKDLNAYCDLNVLKEEDVVYSCDNEIWNKYLSGEYIWEDNELVPNPDYAQETAKKYATELENTLYKLKAQKAYGGILINDLLIFETNQTSITNTVASIALMQDTDTTNWKYYNLDNVPTFVPTTKAQLVYIAQFARKMIDDSFVVEGKYNNIVVNATVKQLNSEKFRNKLLADAKAEFDEVNNKLNITFGVNEQITGIEE